MPVSNRSWRMMILCGLAMVSPANAQWSGHGGASREGGNGVNIDRAVSAAILSDVARDRQAERDARQRPYASPGYGPIDTAGDAALACADSALQQAEPSASIAGKPIARQMATGWEVEGGIKREGSEPLPFICSVRNGFVSAVKLGD